jgi:hypothetical protein
VEGPASNSQDDSEGEEAEVPGQGCTEVVAQVVDSKKVVIDQSFHDVEDTPSGRQKPNLEPDVGRDPAPLPGTQHEQYPQGDEQPRADVKQAVSQGVRLEPSNRVDGMIFGVAEHVMPLEELVDDNAVDEPAKT